MEKRVTRPPAKNKPAFRKKGIASAESTTVPGCVQEIYKQLEPLLADNIPESTACALIGLDFKVWDDYCVRYPGLRISAKKAQAAKLVEWQKCVEAGAQGWQAAATLLERRDPLNWSRTSVGRPTNQKSPYASALSRRKGK